MQEWHISYDEKPKYETIRDENGNQAILRAFNRESIWQLSCQLGTSKTTKCIGTKDCTDPAVHCAVQIVKLGLLTKVSKSKRTDSLVSKVFKPGGFDFGFLLARSIKKVYHTKVNTCVELVQRIYNASNEMKPD